eukprot:723282-Heterocapsa_arctica.AAC.1
MLYYAMLCYAMLYHAVTTRGQDVFPAAEASARRCRKTRATPGRCPRPGGTPLKDPLKAVSYTHLTLPTNREV